VTYLVGSQSIEIVTRSSSRIFGQSDIAFGDAVNDVSFDVTDPQSGERYRLGISRYPVDGVPLTYTRIGNYLHNSADGPALDGDNFVFGISTDGADVPKTGSATYSTSYLGAVSDTSDPKNTTVYIADNTSGSASFTADFLAGRVTTTIDLNNAKQWMDLGGVKSFGILSGTGLIVSNSPAFDGTFTNADIPGEFHGAFFGPQAVEMGLNFQATGRDFQAGGWVVGRKN
jgi:hypothetical protein